MQEVKKYSFDFDTPPSYLDAIQIRQQQHGRRLEEVDEVDAEQLWSLS